MAIPWIDFTEEGLNLEEGSEGWKRMSKKVKEACESDGWFVLVYNKITREAREGMIEEMKALFDLPQETKQKYVSPKAYRSYHGTCPVIPLVESFGLDDAHLQDTAHAFTTLMWPQGNPNFCERLKEMSRELVELNAMLVKMIVEGVLGDEKNWNEAAEKLGSTSNMRLMKYRVPGKEDSEAALVPHTDKSTLTILTQNDVHGLQFLTKDGQWVQPTLPPNAFTVIVGDVLKAWSNGILHAVSHRVIMGGPKVRYSLGVFVMPNDDTEVEVPPQLLLHQARPLRYRPFTYGHYFDFYTSSPQDNALELFAAL